jgi:FAD:protein FMN transferase
MSQRDSRRRPPRARFAALVRFLCCAPLGALFGLHAQAGEQTGVIALSGSTMGTTWHVRVVAAENATSKLQADIDSVLEEVNDQMSTFRPESEISLFNRYSESDWFAVSPEVVTVVQRALEVAADSGGAFDPTVSPLVGLWNFGADAGNGELPTDAAIQEARKHVDYRLVETRTDPPALRKRDPQVRIDLSAIAKGYGVDRVGQLVTDSGAGAWMVEIGGEVRTRGSKPDGSGWRIGIEQPLAGERMLDSTLELHDSALATSGDYRNYFERDGVRYSHEINPATGRPIAHNLASVTVLADDCMTADAWATTLMVLGPDDGAAWARQRGIAAYFIIHNGNGFTASQTASFPKLERPTPPEVAGGWTTFLLALAVFGLATIGLAIGVIVSNRRLHGTCGGLAGMQDEHGRPICEACTNPAEECDEFRRRVAAAPAGESKEAETDSV